MGLQDVFFRLRLPFDSEPRARAVAAHFRGSVLPCPAHLLRARPRARRASRLCPDPRRARANCNSMPGGRCRKPTDRWRDLKREIAAHGLRNSLLIAIAPTATIASIAGCYECIEPQVSNLFKRETLSGRFPADQRLSGRGAEAAGTVDTGDARRHQARRRIHPAIGVPARRAAADLPHGLGGADEVADRDGGRARRLHRSEPVLEPVHGQSRTSASCPACTCTPGNRGSRPPTTCDPGRPPASPRRRCARNRTPVVACSLENPATCEACQ